MGVRVVEDVRSARGSTAAVLHVMETHDAPEPINVGTGGDLTIGGLAELVADVAGLLGTITWVTTKPDGTARKLLDKRGSLNPVRQQRPLWRRDSLRWYVRHRSRLRPTPVEMR